LIEECPEGFSVGGCGSVRVDLEFFWEVLWLEYGFEAFQNSFIPLLREVS
jgi:hypothetical protein